MDDVITNLPNSLSSQPGSSISMPKGMQKTLNSLSSTPSSLYTSSTATSNYSTGTIISIILIVLLSAI